MTNLLSRFSTRADDEGGTIIAGPNWPEIAHSLADSATDSAANSTTISLTTSPVNAPTPNPADSTCRTAVAAAADHPTHCPPIRPGAFDAKDQFPLPLRGCHIARLFSLVAAAHADKTALVNRPAPGTGARETVTYGQLETRATRLAALLRHRGIAPGQRIALFFEPSIAMCVSMLAVLKAGCAYVPLDPSLPAERLGYIVSHSAPGLVLTHQRLLATDHALPVDDVRVLSVDDPQVARQLSAQHSPLDDDCDLGDHDLDDPAFTADAPIYVIYTSGTTGRPKGVVCTHKNVVRAVYSRALDLRASDVLVHTLNYAFDASVISLLGSVLNGATMVIVPRSVTLDFPTLGQIMQEEGVTWLASTTALVNALTNTVPACLANLRWLGFGGEAASVSVCTALYKLLGPKKVVNLYGPTETGIIATWFRIDSLAQLTDEVPIGYPVFGTELYVLDEAMAPVADGDIGELCIGGPAVADGYLKDDEQTRTAFPLVDIAGTQKRLYRSGDLVRRRADSCLYFVGRRDDQVKINGYRIELAEVQNRLEAAPGVEHAFVCVRAEAGSKHIEAFVTPAAVAVPPVTAFLQRELPGYMIPQRITGLADLPMTANGKVDRTALLARYAAAGRPAAAAASSDRSADTPATRPAQSQPPSGPEAVLEQRLVDLIQHLVPNAGAPIHATSHLTELGLNSLKRAMLLSRIRTDLGYSAAIDDVFAARDCRELASKLRGAAPPDTDTAPAGAAVASADAAAVDADPAPRRSHALLRGAGLVGKAWVPTVAIAAIAAANRFFAAAEVGFLWWILATALGFVGGTLAAALAAVALKWLIIGRYREGQFPRSSATFWRHNTVEGLLALSDRLLTPLFGGTAVMPWWGRLLGARIGRRVVMESGHLSGADLVRVGADVVLEPDVAVRAAALRQGCVTAAKIAAEAGSVVRRKAVLMPGSKLAQGTIQDSLTDHWDGKSAAAPRPPQPQPQTESPAHTSRVSRLASAGFFAAQLAAIVALLGYVQLLLLPLTQLVVATYAALGLAATVALAPLFLVAQGFINLVGLALPYRLVLAGQGEGRYRLWGMAHFRWWLATRIWKLAAMLANLLAGTRLISPLLRLYGARVGRACEMGNVDGMAPALLTIEDEAFIGSESVIGGATFVSGGFELRRTTLAANVFIGNEGFISAGTEVGRDVLVGSMARIDTARDTGEGNVWIGVPPRKIARRPARAQLDNQLFRPRARSYLRRVVLECAGLLLLPLPLLSAAGAFVGLAQLAYAAAGAGSVLAWPLFYMVGAVAAGLVAVASKWLIIGRYQPRRQYHLWNDGFVQRRNIVELIVGLAAAVLLPFLGSALWTRFWRLLGANIGPGTILLSAKICEPDLVSIGADVIVGPEVRIQGHTFEERRLQHNPVRIGNGTTLAHRSLVLPEANIHSRATLLPLTLAMKGETLTGGTWAGSPARAVGQPPAALALPTVALPTVQAASDAAVARFVAPLGVRADDHATLADPRQAYALPPHATHTAPADAVWAQSLSAATDSGALR